MPATRFLLYARKSNDREDRQIRSLEDQLHLAREDVRRDRLCIVQEIAEAQSAKQPGKRDGFQAMIRRVEAGEADGILCWHPDRLARNAVDGGWILDLLDRGKLKELRFLSYHFDNSPEGKFALGMVFSQAKYYVDKLSTDVSRGMRRVRQEGGFPHYVPEGYKNVRLELGQKTVAVDPQRFTLLRRAVESILSGLYSPAEALRRLNEWGYQTRTTRGRPGGKLSAPSFYRLLHNPFYAGRCREGGGWYQGSHTPLVSEAEFSQLQRILSRVSGGASLVYRKHAFVYAGGLFTCGRCGCQITASRQSGESKRGDYVYYHCTNRKGVCDRRTTRQEQIEADVTALLRRATIPEELGQALLDVVDQAVGARQSKSEGVVRGTAQRLVDATAERDKLLPLLLKGVVSNDEYARAKAALDAEVLNLSVEEEARRQWEAEQYATARNVVSFAMDAETAFQNGTVEEKRRVVQMLTSRRVLTPREPLLEPHPYLQGFISFNERKRPIELANSGSGSTKKTFSDEKVAFGGPNENRIYRSSPGYKGAEELVSGLFEVIGERRERLPWLTALP